MTGGRPDGVGRLRHAVNQARERLPLRPLEEQVDRVLSRQALRADRAVEDAEVARYLAAHPAPAAADVVTVTATYRRPELVARAVRSALAQRDVGDQRIGEHRVVVVDDGGGGTELIPADPRVTVVALAGNTRNAGLVRNVALRLTRSPFVAFLDDDNLWTPDHLAGCLAALRAGADLVYSAVTVVDAEDHEITTWRREWDRRVMRYDNYVDLNAVVARRDAPGSGPDGLLLSRLRRRPRSPRYEDWELAWRVSRRGRVAHVPAATVRYRLGAHASFRVVD